MRLIEKENVRLLYDKEFIKKLTDESDEVYLFRGQKKIKVYDLYEENAEIDLGEHSNRHGWGPNMEPPNRYCSSSSLPEEDYNGKVVWREELS